LQSFSPAIPRVHRGPFTVPRNSRERRNAVRIIGGAWRSRLIRFPESAELRPSPDRVRETLFNWLGQDLSGKACLDLFAGSGALGFEAASRGAAPVVLVESDGAVHAALCANARLLDAGSVHVEKADALEFLAHSRSQFDVIFLDPPFRRGVDAGLLRGVARSLTDRGVVYLESDRAFADAAGWQILRQARAGNVHFHLLKHQREVQ
jgi:16S rRNA (guanine966-N2)-methyltransferase